MSNLRDFAEGKPCTLRFPGCDGGGETTVLAHIRIGNIAGVGQKPPDLCGAHSCVNCHDILDGRKKAPADFNLELRTLMGVIRTLAEVSRNFTVRKVT